MRRVWFVGLVLLVWSRVGAQEPALVEHVQRGEALAAQGQTGAAIEEYEKALEAGAGSALVLNRLAALYLQTGALPKAAVILRRSLQEKPSRNPEAHRLLGVCYTQLDSLEPAIAQFRQVIQILPDDLEAHNNIAFLLAGQQRYREALESYERARQLAKDPMIAHAIKVNMEAVQAIMAGKMRARYILVDTQAQAREVLLRLQNGEAFEALAAHFSKAANARDGGDTGFFGPGELLEDFEKAVLQLEAGQISEPLEVPLGVLIIQRVN